MKSPIGSIININADKQYKLEISNIKMRNIISKSKSTLLSIDSQNIDDILVDEIKDKQCIIRNLDFDNQDLFVFLV